MNMLRGEEILLSNQRNIFWKTNRKTGWYFKVSRNFQWKRWIKINWWCISRNFDECIVKLQDIIEKDDLHYE